nr:uncharacterized mitochondrial protein AtMg00810-like [Tanacetum cinerariifolium]
MSQPLRNQSVVRQPTAFKYERPRISKPQCDSQVDVHNNLSKPVTTHYLPKEREAASAKPHHMIASINSRTSLKNMTRFSSNDMVYNHYLEEAKTRIQERSRNSKPSLLPSVRSKSIANGSKPMPRRNTQTSRNWPASKNSFVTTKTMPIAEHPRNSRNDSCVTKFLKNVNSRAKVPSNKTTNRNKPVEQTGVPHKQKRQIPTGHRFSIQKTSVVQKKTITPRSCIRWKLTGIIFKTIGLRWVPTGKIFTSITTKVDSKPMNGSNAYITNQYECEQTLDISTDADVPSQQELDMLFGPLYDEFFNAGTNPSTTIPSTSAPSAHINMHAEETNNDQAEEREHIPDDAFTNPFYHPLEQVRRNPSRPVQTRRQLAIDPEMCMYALTVSTAEPKNIKEAIADSAWIEAMQEKLHQFDRLKAKYTLEILHKHGMDKGQSIGTPIATKPKLDADLSRNPVDQTNYRSKIRSLMYLTSSRPNIVQVVCFCARYQSRPTEKHLKEVKRIFRYLRGTVNMGLWYPKGSSFKLTAFSDADHAGCIDTHKSTSGGIQFLGEKLVSWMSKKHNYTAMSSAEAEYVALSASCAQVMWMRTQLQDYGFNYNKIPLYCDSQSAIAISCNPVQHSRTKHIHTRFKYLVRRIGMRCLTLGELEVLENESA